MEMDRFKYSAQVYAYIAKPMKKELDQLRDLDPRRMSNSQVIEDALGEYLPKLKAKVGLFTKPSQGAPGRRKRRAA